MNKLLFKIKLKTASPEERASLYIKQFELNAGCGCRFFGDVDFGSEPYLIKLGDKVMLSDGVRFSTHDGGMQVLDNLGLLDRPDYFGKINIGNNVFIGMNAIILKGVEIGDNVVVGAGAIVTKPLAPNAVYAGVPARRISSLADYCEKASLNIDHTFGMCFEEKKNYLIAKFGLDNSR